MRSARTLMSISHAPSLTASRCWWRTSPRPARSGLGLGLAVHIVLARFDDHLSFYRLEQQFRERYGVAIPRQQMVQWAEHIATWLRPLYDAVWKAMLAAGYMQIDETPVRVLDP